MNRQTATCLYSQLQHQKTYTATCTVDITEPTGPDTLVFVHLNDRSVVCRVHPDIDV